MSKRKQTLNWSKELGFCVTKEPLYHIWYSMVKRCTNKKATNYAIYGGRGVSVCSSWLSFPRFHKDMKSTYQKGLTLERINNDGAYCKSNCRWATRKEQANNRRTNRYLIYQGKKQTLLEWSKELGISKTTLCMRLKSKTLTQKQVLTAGLLRSY